MSDRRPLPWSQDAEQAILATVIMQSPDHEIALRLSNDYFFLPQHRKIFGAIKELVAQGKQPDLVTIVDYLGDDLQSAGGAAYLASLLDGMPRVAPIAQWVAIVANKAERRRIMHIADQIRELAWTANGNSSEVIDRIRILSAYLEREARAETNLPFKTTAEIARETPAEVDWIAAPWVAAGSITEIAGKVKAAGKTTWVTHLVAAILDGARFMNFPTYKSPVVYLTEQPPASFRVALERAHLLNRDDLFVLYRKDTVGKSWESVARSAISQCKVRGARLLVVDTIGQFAQIEGDSENNSGDAMSAMRPLQEAEADNIGVLVIRHERKSGGEVCDAGRGSSAFAGAVDVVLSMRRPEGHGRKTLRIIRSLSRFGETPEELVIDFTENGYVALGTASDVALMEAKETILGAAPSGESNAADLKTMLEGTTVSRSTGQRAIKELVSSGRLGMTGTGKRGNPFRYFLPEKVSAQT